MDILKKLFGSEKEIHTTTESEESINPPMPEDAINLKIGRIDIHGTQNISVLFNLHYPDNEHSEAVLLEELQTIYQEFYDGSHGYIRDAIKNLQKAGFHLSSRNYTGNFKQVRRKICTSRKKSNFEKIYTYRGARSVR